MPTAETWLQDNIVEINWSAPLAPSEVRICFRNLVAMLNSVPDKQKVNVLIEIKGAASVPAQAPTLAIRSGFLMHRNVDRIAVVGADAVPKFLPRVVQNVTRREVMFFPTQGDAMQYLRDE